MSLSPPYIVPPVSACADFLRLQGQVTGSYVQIFASKTNIFEPLFEGFASGPDEVFQLNRALKEGEKLFARQSYQNESTTFSPPLAEVQASPQPGEIGSLNLYTHLFHCGKAVMLGNAYPGAEVEIFSQQGSIGKAIAFDGFARIGLTRGLLPNDALSCVQKVCGMTGTLTPLPAVEEPPHSGQNLNFPLIKRQVYECDAALRIEEVVDGATVTLFRGDEESPYATANFDLPGLWFRVKAPFHKNEKLSVDQVMKGCELRSSRVSVLAEALPVVPRPDVAGPLCPGAFAVRVSGLRYGALVKIVQDGLEIGGGEAWDETCDFYVDSLNPVRGDEVSARQSLCGRWSELSSPVKIDHRPSDLKTPVVVGPLFACGGVVRVSSLRRGAYVELWNQKRLLSAKWVYEPTAEFFVAPALREGDKIYAFEKGCGLEKKSIEEIVRPHERLNAPKISDCGTQLAITEALPGARVEVYRNGTYFMGKYASASTVIFPLSAPLNNEDVLKARQLMCDQVSDFTEPVFLVRSRTDKRALNWVVGSTKRICQLTGDTDPQGIPKLTKTSSVDIKGTDLGIVIDHTVNGEERTYFFFGDTDTIDPDHDTAGDAIAWTVTPDPEPYGLLLNFVTRGDGLFRRLVVPGIDPMGGFEVPTGGFSHGDKLYVFVTDDHYMSGGNDYMGRSLLAVASDNDPSFTHPGKDFTSLYEISNKINDAAGGFKFINIAAWKVLNADWPGLPDIAKNEAEGVVLIGSGEYRESLLHMAYVPISKIEDPSMSGWRFFAGFTRSVYENMGPCGRPKWVNAQKDATPLFQDNRVYGELSLTYNRDVGLWILMYNAMPGIWLRHAVWPWGPWSEPVLIFEGARDGGSGFIEPGGGVYGPYQAPRYSKWDGWKQELTIYFVMSTWRPYQPMLMRTTLTLGCRYRDCV